MNVAPSDLPELVQIERELGLRGSLRDFVRMAWHLVEPGVPFVDGWHIGAMSEHLEAVRLGQIRDLVVTVPPGCMKSLTTSVFWPTHSWILDPGLRFMVASFDASLTVRDARRSLEIMESKWFRDRWGDRFSIPSDPAAGDFTNSAAGFRFSTSVGGKATGRHADAHIYDDPLKPLDVNEHTLAECWRWATETMGSRFRDQMTGRRVCIMQRLHELDLAGRFASELGFEVLRLPMRFEEKACSHTSIGGDTRTEEGALLWPERFPEAAVAKIERNLGTARAVAAQLQQRPAPAEGAIFKKEHIQRYKVCPARFDRVVQSWDLAFKDGAKNDYVAGQVWGRVGPNYYLLAYVLKRLDFPATLEEVKKVTKAWPRALTKLVEDKANGPAVIAMLKKTISGFVPVTPEGGKVARANAVAPLFEGHNVFVPDVSIEGSEWVDAFVENLCGFPFVAHDDDVDCCTQALNYLSQNTSAFGAAMKKLREKGRTT